ncbi:MAG: FG-GAP-like repeat-containing protein, partial [Vicinamibacteria bacterium]
ASELLAQVDPRHRQANRGVALLEQFRFTEAAAAFEEVVALAPGSVAGYINLGIAYFNERDFEKSRAAFEKAKTLAPENPYVHYNLGLIDKLQGNTEEAAAAFERVAALDPSDSMTQYYLGTLYANLGRLDEAEATLRGTIALQPGNESAHFSLGNVLIRQGRREEGQKELLIFRELKESFPAEAASAGLQYTELGRYAEAVEESSEARKPSVPETVREGSVRFVPASSGSGLELAALEAPPSLPPSLPAAEYDLDFVRERVLPRLGTGIAFRDLDVDSDPDLLFAREGAPLFFRNQGGKFEKVTGSGLPESGNFIGVVVGDVDNDKDGDVYLSGSGGNALYLNDGSGKFTESPDPTVRGDGVSVSASFADVDHDGDLDLYVSSYVSHEAPAGVETLTLPRDLPGAPNRLYRNDGNGAFTEIGRESGTDGGNPRSLGAVFSDLDEDRDVDFVVINDGSRPLVFSNDRVGTFTESAAAFGLETGSRTRGADSGDYDRDGSFDFFFTAEGNQLNSLWRGPARGGFRSDVFSPGLLTAGVPGGRYGAQFLDVDNDADLDLLVVVNEEDALVGFYENTPSGFVRAGSLDPGVLGEGRALAHADVDSDGDLDFVVATDRGELALFLNEGGNARSWISVRAQGLRSNLDGLGAKVEVRAGGESLRREVRSTSGYFSQSDLPLHFGLGEANSADYVRFLWPGGVKQIEMDVAANSSPVIEELNRKGTSCPVLYAWDGEKIRFVTDFLGGSAFGYLLAPGRYNTPDSDETVKMEPFPLVARDGRYDVRFVNQLEEVIFYDRASLLVVDHPEDVEVYPNERLMPSPPFPEPRLYPVTGARPPASAIDHRGEDVTGLISQRDRLYPDQFRLLPFKGYAEEHSLTLDLGRLETGAHHVLLLHGWVDYADSSANLAASQAGVALVPPYLEVSGESGAFEKALPQMGFPAGLPKTMLVDLEGLVSPERSRVRIVTSMRIYWDQIRVAKVVPEASLSVKELEASSAELRRLGYPAPFRPDDRLPSLYTYDRILETELWGAHEGYYTRYGDVEGLVSDVDDRYVITHHGDELLLGFEEVPEPPRPGYHRSFLVLADGFGKDMDLSSAFADTLEPLPFHGMASFPYSSEEGYPDDEEMRKYREKYNTRYVGKDKATPFGKSATTP